MYLLDGNDEWSNIHSSDLWIYNKLFLSRVLEYTCGPVGTTVPKPDFYIVRPSFNLLGMGRFSRKEWIENHTDHFHPAEFWCEIFTGEHLSVDFKNQESELVVLGTKNEEDPYYKWKKWEKIDKKVEFPEILRNLMGDYEYINCEFIGNKLIEVHFRQNPDFRYNNTVAIPIWNEKDLDFYNLDEYNFIKDSEYERIGFLIK
jgi:hypothetical protein